ncbi:hypothetical protein KFE25_010210 [Diacronema lutheri]|uniref:Protein kinase domain-containing protein n=2 Tax=Diacronema lutheri TaxID=2081491 RepID=A0A8J6C7U9_DIALT|nr:hypothetical protein KFE25_010210 [Diacronema lutheri]
MESAQARFPLGVLHGRYGVRKLLRRSARAREYLATDTVTGASVRLERISSSLFGSALTIETVRETQLLRELRAHSNASTLEAVLYDDSAGARWLDFYRVYRWLEYDLHAVLASGTELSGGLVACIAFQMLAGVDVLHRAGVAHGSLSPACILVGARCEVCVTELACCREIAELQRAPRECDAAIPPLCAYAAPERLLGERWGAAADAWSLGCIIAELLQRRPLFQRAPHGAHLAQMAELLGTPHGAQLAGWVSNGRARAHLESLPQRPFATLADRMPGAPPQTLDVVERLVRFAPAERATVSSALCLPAFAALAEERTAAAERVAADTRGEETVRPFRFRTIEAIGLSPEDDLRIAMWEERTALHGTPAAPPPAMWLRPGARAHEGEHAAGAPSLEQLALRALLVATVTRSGAPAARRRPSAARDGAGGDEEPRQRLDDALCAMLPDERLLSVDGILAAPASFGALGELPLLRQRVGEALRAGLNTLAPPGVGALRRLVDGLRWRASPPAWAEPLDGPAVRSVAAHLIRELSELHPSADGLCTGRARSAEFGGGGGGEFESVSAVLKLLHDVRILAPKHRHGRCRGV